MNVSINYWAVLVATAAAMVVGAVWYSPILFAKPWMALVGKRQEDMKKGVGPLYAITAVATLLCAYILAHFVDYTGANTWLLGLQTGFWAWLGFVAPTILVESLFAGRAWKLYVITVGHHLVSLLVMGAILAAWK